MGAAWQERVLTNMYHLFHPISGFRADAVVPRRGAFTGSPPDIAWWRSVSRRGAFTGSMKCPLAYMYHPYSFHLQRQRSLPDPCPHPEGRDRCRIRAHILKAEIAP